MSDKRNIFQRLAGAMSEVSYIQNEFKQGMKYRIVSHDAVTAKVRPALLKHGVHYRPLGVTYTQNGNRTECHMVVRFTNIDDPQDCFDVESIGYGVDTQDKGPGKAMSYAVKYALLKALGLETGEDPDLDQDTEHDPVDRVAGPKPVTGDPIPAASHTALVDMLNTKGLPWAKVVAAIEDEHGVTLPSDPSELPRSWAKKVKAVIDKFDDAKKVDPDSDELTPEQQTKAKRIAEAAEVIGNTKALIPQEGSDA